MVRIGFERNEPLARDDPRSLHLARARRRRHVPRGGCGARTTPIGRVAGSVGASPWSQHVPMCMPEAVKPSCASSAVRFVTSAICSEVSAASSSRSVAISAVATGCARAQRFDA
jgi:hypothetical protein